MEFRKGDTVMLKSGGPVMTVANLAADGNYYCRWFAGDEVKSYTFTREELQKADPA